MNNLYKQLIAPTVSLFTSIGTLICCALPALLVTLGMGAALAGFISNFPWITQISEYKIIIFVVAGLLLTLSAYLQWHGRNAPCPTDPAQAKACLRLRHISLGILAFSVIIYLIGFFFTFLAVHIFY